MSVFTDLAPAQVSAWLGRYSLGTLVDLAGIAAGVENSNFFVTTTHGRYVLTLFERLGRDELPFYLHLMAHLARHGIPCPAPIADRDNEFLGTLAGRPAVIVTCLPGRSVTVADARHCSLVGGMLADMHVAGESYHRHQENPRGPRWWHDTAHLVMPHLTSAEQALLKDELRFQALHRRADIPGGVIHADLFRDNVLFEDGRIGGVIDFYFAGVDALLFDLAVVANDWCTGAGGELDPTRTRALLRAYHPVRALTPLEHGAWPVMLRAAALRFWLSRLHDRFVPRTGHMVLVKEPAEYRDILRRRVADGGQAPWLD
ncbi:MAG: homoserine kinase [Betaproteobacteria bacterium]|nr:homoserine kinase [Betaproteobacteria bacterium]